MREVYLSLQLGGFRLLLIKMIRGRNAYLNWFCFIKIIVGVDTEIFDTH